MGPPVRTGGPTGWRDESGCCLAVSGLFARVSGVSGDVAVSRVGFIGDVRFRAGLVRSVAWSLWSVAWSVRSVIWSVWSGLVRSAGDRIAGGGVAGVGGQVGDGLLDAGQRVADAGQEPQVARRQGLYWSVRGNRNRWENWPA